MPRIVISASRRTDIPAFYMPWFMNRIQIGHFELANPYSKKISQLPASPDQVHTIVFWSKDFAPFLDGGYGRQLAEKGYHLFFNFTINSPHPILEPAVPPLEQRLAQLRQLADLFGPQAIQWRFDPICHYRLPSGETDDNLDQFRAIAQGVAQTGITTCITSFVDLYRKVKERQRHLDLQLFDPPLAQKVARVAAMAETLDGMGIQLQLCCEKELLAAMPPPPHIKSAACIPNHHLARLYGDDISLARDAGQRAAAGCGCRVSKDIGNYQHHPCHHRCLFCYANPAQPVPPAMDGVPGRPRR